MLDWDSLQHHGGRASDTPKHLARLRSHEETTRRQAALVLHATLYAPNTFYDAALRALPLLVDALLDEDTPDRHRIAYLLANIVTGHQKSRLERGIDLSDPGVRALYDRSPAREILSDLSMQAPALVSLLDAPEPRLRARATVLLAFLSPASAVIVPALCARLDEESEQILRCTLLFGLGLQLGTARDARARERILRAFVEREADVVRAAALLALSYDREQPLLVPPADSVKALVRAGDLSEKLFPFNEGAFAALGVSRLKLLASLGAPAARSIADALLDVLPSTPNAMARWIALGLETVLGPPSRIDVALLDAWQRSALARLSSGEVTSNAFLKYGLPANSARRRQWLDSTEDPAA